MTTGGWIFMILAWGVIIAIPIYCYGSLIMGNKDEPAQDQNKISE